ncbi:hypothetical protein ACQUWX_18340, partial [Ralstonia pseudosolanacearum]
DVEFRLLVFLAEPVQQFVARGEALRNETREDFRLARRWGITGFPSLLAEQAGTLYQIGRGYAPSVALYARAVEVLAQHPAPDAG